MKLTEYKGHYVDGIWQVYTADVFDVTMQGDRLTVDGKYLPLIYAPKWALKATKRGIMTTHTPEDFWRHFFEDDFWRKHMYTLCKHIRANGKPVQAP